MQHAPNTSMLFVCNDLSYFAAHRYHVKRLLKAMGWYVQIVADPGVLSQDLWPEHFTPMRVVRRSLSVLNDLKNLWQLWRLIRTTKPQLIHAMTIKPILIIGLLMRLRMLAGRPTTPLVCTLPGLGEVFRPLNQEPLLIPRIKRRIRKSLVKRAYQFIVQNPSLVMTFENSHDCAYAVREFGLRGHKALVVNGAGVDIEDFTGERIALPQLPIRVLFAARLLKSKGIYDFMDAVRMAREAGANIQAQIAGVQDPGNPESITNAELQVIGRTGAFEYLGFIDDMPNLLRQTDIVILPTFYREGLPRVLIEAAAAGCALLAYNAPGVSEIVKHRKNGHVVNMGDVKRLSQYLVKLVEEPELLFTMQKASLKLIGGGKFSEQAVQEQFLGAYKAVELVSAQK